MNIILLFLFNIPSSHAPFNLLLLLPLIRSLLLCRTSSINHRPSIHHRVIGPSFPSSIPHPFRSATSTEEPFLWFSDTEKMCGWPTLPLRFSGFSTLPLHLPPPSTRRYQRHANGVYCAPSVSRSVTRPLAKIRTLDTEKLSPRGKEWL